MTPANAKTAPPPTLDGAKVLAWARASSNPFGHVAVGDGGKQVAICGLAICRYDDTGPVYRFSCDKSWNLVQDSPYDSVEDAITRLPNQYLNVKVEWHST